jgi:hypothetical protein
MRSAARAGAGIQSATALKTIADKGASGSAGGLSGRAVVSGAAPVHIIFSAMML